MDINADGESPAHQHGDVAVDHFGAGRSVFDLSLSGPPPPGSGAPGPPKQKTKTDRFLTVT